MAWSVEKAVKRDELTTLSSLASTGPASLLQVGPSTRVLIDLPGQAEMPCYGVCGRAAMLG